MRESAGGVFGGGFLGLEVELDFGFRGGGWRMELGDGNGGCVCMYVHVYKVLCVD